MKRNNVLIYPRDILRKGRSTWTAPHRDKFSFNHGDAVPFFNMEILPADEIQLNLADLIRMSTPIVPIMDDITCHVAAYFVSSRIIFENWEELCGVNKDGAWTVGLTDVVNPHFEYSSSEIDPRLDANITVSDSFITSNSGFGTYPDAFKYHTLMDYITGSHRMNKGVKLIAAPFRAYYEVINEYYRSEVVSSRIPVDKSNNNAICVGETFSKTMYRKCEPLGKYPDLFTKMLPQPQKGDAVKFLHGLIPVGSFAPVSGTLNAMVYPALDNNLPVTADTFYQYHVDKDAGVSGFSQAGVFANLDYPTLNIGQTINDLRYAFQLQKFMEADARYGTNRYVEYLEAHFGISISDGVAQRPIPLGESNFRINIDQVVSTAGYDVGANQTVGAPGAVSATGHKCHLMSYTSKEHGYIIFIVGCRHNHTYSNGIDRYLQHINKLDFYHPEFANIGEQAVYAQELGADYATVNYPIGYQEAWYEYRYFPDKVKGLLNPQNTGSLDYWTLADKYDPLSAPILNESFIYEGRDSIARCLVTGWEGPDYIADFLMNFKVTRVMPVYSIPGYADHH